MPATQDPPPGRVSTDGPTSRRVTIPGLIGWLALCFAASAIGVAAVVRTRDDWYLTIRKPPWTPPNAVFGPVWTILYTMMAVSAWLVWRRRAEQPDRVRVALGWFVAQLALNTAWSWIFFAGRRPGSAFVEIAVLWVAIAITIERETRVSRPAALLMIPYLAWVTFASALNGAIWYLNA